MILLTALVHPGLAREKYETIDATAYGTSTQLGRNVAVTVIVYEWSTPEDRQILLETFQKGQNQGLVNALQKVKAVGRIQIPGSRRSLRALSENLQFPSKSALTARILRPGVDVQSHSAQANRRGFAGLG